MCIVSASRNYFIAKKYFIAANFSCSQLIAHFTPDRNHSIFRFNASMKAVIDVSWVDRITILRKWRKSMTASCTVFLWFKKKIFHFVIFIYGWGQDSYIWTKKLLKYLIFIWFHQRMFLVKFLQIMNNEWYTVGWVNVDFFLEISFLVYLNIFLICFNQILWDYS